MARISLKIRDQESPLVIDGEPGDIRRIAFHFNKMLGGEPTDERRFVFREPSSLTSTTLYIDLKQVQWLTVLDEMPKAPAEENA